MQNQSPVHESATELVGMPPADSNITDLIVASCADRPDAPVYAVRNGAGGWVDVHFTAFLTQVRAVAPHRLANPPLCGGLEWQQNRPFALVWQRQLDGLPCMQLNRVAGWY